MKYVTISVATFLGWLAICFGLLAALVSLSFPGFTVLLVPFIIYSFYRAFIQVFSFPSALRMRRILRVYPWSVVGGAPFGLTKHPEVLGRQYGWFEFPNPARSEERLPVVFPNHLQVGWWHRRMAPRATPELKAQIDTVWFAGDPRFIGLVAAPRADGAMPRRMHVLHQQMGAEGGRRSLADWGATAEDIERGRRVGIRPARP
ncbi:hypothetical protein [Streptomyces sporangiiformans]|uniref:Uncharacterized protein n=1 Tax=Streptomyces sporangiiformans TaxID=2315329 RepID=A0A505D6V9_9ACTN|nr:hypothetical protein [Streptomyces sporangiiformans]TPQ20233.1 hypothetical protein FGD71_021445 [Streptomyces sporangiiformans]